MEEKNPNRRIRIIDRVSSQRKIQIKNQNKSIRQAKGVKFSQKLIDSQQSRKKHHSASILKKRNQSSLDKNAKPRSDSINSMASQGPLDDQSCQNSNLNKSIKQQYVHLIQVTTKRGKYIDSFFPPVISSLFSYSARRKNKYPNIKWMRLSQIYKGKVITLYNQNSSGLFIRPSTNLSAQYFSLAFNIIKNNKSLLKKMFEDQVYNDQGVYYVKIFQSKVWKYMIVDDNIPIIETDNQKLNVQPLFIKCQFTSQKIQIWPYILEKALAKLYSSYQALQSGNIFDFLEQLTNKTCQQFEIQANKQNLKQIAAQPESIFFGQSKQNMKIPIQIQNSSSVSFTFQIGRKQVKCDLNQLAGYFNKIYVLGAKPFSYIGYCPIRQTKQSISVRQFSLKKTTFCSLTLNQKDKRYFQEPIKYQYSWIRMIIVQKQINGSYRWIDGRYDNQKTMTIQTQLQAGDYSVIIMPQWQERSFQVVLIIRAKIPIHLDRKIYEQGTIQQACADLAQRYGRLNQLNTFICSYNCIHQDMGFIIENINNERMKGQIKIVRSIDGLKSNVEIEAVNKQFRDSKSIEVVIKHNSHYTVVLKMKGGLDRTFFQNFDFGGK